MRNLRANSSTAVKCYMRNSSVHGLKYIVDEEAHWLEKLFWICVCLSCVYGTYTVFAASWRSFKDNPVSFVVETTYLDWNTTFPAVTVCEKRSADKIESFSEKLFGADRNLNLDTFVGDVAFFNGICSSCIYHCGTDIECPDNLTYLTEMLRSQCRGILKDCQWNDEKFDCCEEFEAIDTGFGECYTINSMQGNRWWKGNRSVSLKSNRITGKGVLTFRAQEDIKIAIHSPEDIMFNHGSPDQFAMIEYGQILEMIFQVVEIINDVHVKDIPVESRSCRFPDENPLKLYPYYSYSACITECEAKAQMEFCGCVHHVMPKSALSRYPICNISGLICISNHNEHLKVVKNKWSDKPGLLCECPSSCTEQEFKILQSEAVDIVKYHEQGLPNPRIMLRSHPSRHHHFYRQVRDIEFQEEMTNTSSEDTDDYSLIVAVQMASLPTERLSRNVVRTRLDIVVSLGGTAGLFLGASLLSIVELVYYFFIRRPDCRKVAGKQPIPAPAKKHRKINIMAYHNNNYKKTFQKGDAFYW